MEMTVEEADGATCIILNGRLDVKGAGTVELKFSAIAGVRPRVAVDLTGVDFIASMGIRLLVMAGKNAASRGNKLALFGASDAVKKVIVTTGLDQIVPLAADWAGARSTLA